MGLDPKIEAIIESLRPGVFSPQPGVLHEAEERLAELEARGLWTWAPPRIDAAKRATLPLLCLAQVDARRMWEADFRRNATVVAVDLGTGSLRQARLFSGGRRARRRVERRVSRVGASPTGDDAQAFFSHVLVRDLRALLDLPWCPATYLISLVVADWCTPAVTVRLVAEGPTARPRRLHTEPPEVPRVAAWPAGPSEGEEALAGAAREAAGWLHAEPPPLGEYGVAVRLSARPGGQTPVVCGRARLPLPAWAAASASRRAESPSPSETIDSEGGASRPAHHVGLRHVLRGTLLVLPLDAAAEVLEVEWPVDEAAMGPTAVVESSFAFALPTELARSCDDDATMYFFVHDVVAGPFRLNGG